MKANDRLMVLAIFGYSYLFYNQNAGINFLIFDLLIMLLFVFRDKRILKSPNWLWAACLCLMSGLAVLINSSALSLIANATSLLILSAFSMKRHNSSLVSFVFASYSVLVSAAYIIERIFQPHSASIISKSKFFKNAFVGIIVFVLSVFFLLLYKSANPLFAKNIEWINLDFFSFSWLVFTGLGFILCFGIFNYRIFERVESWELQSTGFTASVPEPVRKGVERQAGNWLFVMLNLMLLILNIGDFNSLILGGDLPQGVKHTDFVHQGVGNVILSILVAVSIIMYIFRYCQQDSESRILKILVSIWLVQTIMMVLSTCERNLMYVDAFGLTLKRIGVFYWLGGAIVGLLILGISMWRVKGNWFLIRKNFAVWVSVLVLSSLINWDQKVVEYNLFYRQANRQDFHYLLSLSDAAIPALNIYFNTVVVNKHHINASSLYEFKLELHQKVQHFLKDYKGDWQSWDLRDKQIINSIMDQKR